MIYRRHYLDRIQPFIGKPVVKAVTGLRRAGKSVFLRQVMEILKQNNISAAGIIYIDKESLEYDNIKDYKDLDLYVRECSKNVPGKIYVFVDEIQDIDQWERTVASWSGQPDRYDITITGSNSTMFSGELATKLTGRYIEFRIYPLSLLEFRSFYPEIPPEDILKTYLRFGGMPGLRILDKLSPQTAYPFLNSIHDSIVLKDIVRRIAVRNTGLLESVCDFCYDSIGNPVTASSIAAYLKSQRINVNVQSVINYLKSLEDAGLFIHPKRYDIKGKKILEVNSKYYAADLGFRHAKTGYKAGDISQIMENLVFMELLRRYSEVYIGSIGHYEVDFVAMNNMNPTYYQVCLNCNEPQTLEREIRPLLAIRDNYPKTIITMERSFGEEMKGIQIVSLQDFLMSTDNF